MFFLLNFFVFRQMYRNFAFFNINSKGPEEPLLSKFSPNYGGLRILNVHFVMKFQRFNGMYYSFINIPLEFPIVSSGGKLSKKIKTDQPSCLARNSSSHFPR